ncbi:MAG TPA: peptide ABC transporter substrate-binding protein [Nitrolancea sp.]|nr:peptide ABC transporter substrate-binding protein [Nitrolancea sp.]
MFALIVIAVPILAACNVSLPGTNHSPSTSTTSSVTTATAATSAVPEGTAASGTPGSAFNGSSSVTGSPTPRQTPNPSGDQTLTLSGGSVDPPTLDPALVRDADSSFIDRQIFRGLVGLTPALNAQPDLAEKVDLSADKKTYTFHLRAGIKFQSGKPIRAGDVQYSIERATDASIARQAGGSIPALTFLSDIVGVADHAAGRSAKVSGIKVIDDSTLTITLTHPVANFLVKLAGTPAAVVEQSDVARGAGWWKKPDASGPFGVAQWDPGKQLVLSGNRNYLPSPPTLKTVTILFGVNAADPLTLYERNEVDAASVPADAVDRIQAPNSPYQQQLVVEPLLSESYVLLNPNIAPFNDINVRKALIMAFDRSKIATVTYDGHVRVANGIVPSGLQGAAWTATIPKYDPAAAKALLAQTTLNANSAPLTLYTSGDYAPIAMKLQYQSNLGLNSDVVQLEFQDYINDITARKLPALTLDWVADYPDPEDFLRTLFYSTSTENYIGYNNPKVDQLLDQAGAESDPSKRQALYEQAQQLIIDDAVVIPVYDDVQFELIKPHVHGLDVTPIGLLGLETVWLTK